MRPELIYKIHRTKIRRKATKKGKEILEKLRERTQDSLKKKGYLANIKGKWLEELKYINVKLNKATPRDAKIRKIL